MEIRRFRKSRYVVAFIITLLVFLFGIMLGVVMDSQRVAYLENENKVQQMDYSSLQLQYQFIDQLSQEDNCPALTAAMSRSINDLEKARINIENYEQDTLLNKEDFNLIKRDYMINQLRYWLLARKTEELCGTKVTRVLYFYSTKETCPNCEEQAFILTYLKNKYEDNLLNFAIDSKFNDEPMIAMLASVYNVTEYPTLIVNDQKYSGLVTTRQLEDKICGYIGNMTEPCNVD